jgi:N-acetylglucosamine malate deacetylase 1
MFGNVSRVLALSAHTDDAEFGSGGTIARMISLGIEVHSAVFSIARESVPAGLPEDILISECQQSHQILGVASEQLEIMDYPVRHFPAHRQAILERLVQIQRALKPDLVLVHSSTDVHQDHSTVFEEARRAFKSTTILGYNLPWNATQLNLQGVIMLELPHVERKIEALNAYKSQQHRSYANADFIRSCARSWGPAIQTEYAEVFEVIRWVIR